MIVAISGSRSIRTLSSAAIQRLNAIVELGATIRIGDADGADTLVQRFLAERGFRNVKVWHRGHAPRNNVGGWPTQKVEGTYTDRDREMYRTADFGLAIWDGRSPGTARNIQQLGTRMRVVRT